MVILGINASHNATACLFKDGQIISCISEERLSRVKNQPGLPIKAIKRALKESKIKASQVDYVAFSFEDMAINSGFSVLGGGKDLVGGKESISVYSYAWKLKEWMLSNIPVSRYIYPPLQKYIYNIFIFPKLRERLLSTFEKKTKIDREKIRFVDHHSAHAYTAYFGSEKYWEGKRLILTLDAMGDDLCATVSIGENGKLTRISQTPFGNSIGDLYAYTTRYLGMKMGEHEYKVMGMGAYANEKYVDKVYQKIKDWVRVDKDNLMFHTKVFSHVFYKKLDEVYKGERFDNISGAIQKLAEEAIVQWVKAAVKKTGIKEVVCAGGVFMNVKANQKIAQLPQVKSLFVFPSCGDESTAIGAAYFVYQNNKDEHGELPRINPIGKLYFGPKYSNSEILKEIGKARYKKYKVKNFKDIEKEVARLISKRKIVARFSGKMEWGARALGNRSIVTHPQNLEGVRDINEQIKSRDFWMPFAPSIISERMSKYVVNPKNIPGPYMVLAYETTDEGKEKIRAAIHQYDLSARPQEVIKKYNPEYHRLISEFEKLTGIGSVLNTSFNLHGYPIVCSPEDAMFVFENSGLQYLAIGNYLVSK